MGGAPPKPGIRADSGFMLRTPMLPVDTLLEWAPPGATESDARRYLAGVLTRPDVEEAVFVASPALHATIEPWLRDAESSAGQRAEISLVKYVARMAARATPFGLFSAVSAGSLARETSLVLAPRSEYRRRTRLDNDYLYALCDALAKTPEARAVLRFRTSTALYAIAGRLRYAEARLRGTERTYHLVALEPTPYLEATLARAADGARLGELAAALVADDPEITLDEASAYVAELADAQILVPELGVAITGSEPIDHVVARLLDAGLTEPAQCLRGVRDSLAAIDAAGCGNPVDRYRAIATTLECLPATADPGRLFQVDAAKPAAATLSPRIAAEVVKAVEWLRVTARPEEPALVEFRQAFAQRWEGREVPLVEVLDEELGIGFESKHGPGTEGSPLLAGLPFGAPGGSIPRVTWTKADHYLQRRLHEVLAAGGRELVLDEDDLAAMRNDAPLPTPDAFAAMLRIAGNAEQAAAGDVEILWESTFGPSGARLLGRFCHASAEIETAVRAHLRAEEALRPDAVFAEVVHLNEGRIGNILCRPVLRDHEIVFLGISGAPNDRQISIADLLVSIDHDRIVLRSRRLGREVVPRLSTAHNFRLRSLAVYRFLCAIQNQGDVCPKWSWGPLGGAPYLPRVRIGRVVLARQAWRLGRSELAELTAAVRDLGHKKSATVPLADKRARIARAIASLRTSRQLPRFIVLSDADNELPIDLDNPMLVQALADELSGRSEALLEEMWPSPAKTPVRGPEGVYANELVLTFVREPSSNAELALNVEPVSVPSMRAPAIVRQFPPGSSWLYAKLYTGAATADRVIHAAIAPVARRALARGDAAHWFFIRYDDESGPHVRVRFAGEPARLMSEVGPALTTALAPLRETGAIWRIAYDTYEREIERYGGERGIELCEQVFSRDSEAVAALLDTYEGDEWADLRWRLAMRGADQLLVGLGLPAEVRSKLFTGARDMIGREHGAGAALWGVLGERYKAERVAIEEVLADDPSFIEDDPRSPGIAILARRDAAIAPIAAELRRRDQAGELNPRLVDFAWSLVHMHCNRMLHASWRAQEMVLYDFLRRYHESRRARAARSSRAP